MLIGERLRALREAKGLSQGDIEKRIGLLRCYVSRVENDHTTPAVETVEKWARTLEKRIGAGPTRLGERCTYIYYCTACAIRLHANATLPSRQQVLGPRQPKPWGLWLY